MGNLQKIVSHPAFFPFPGAGAILAVVAGAEYGFQVFLMIVGGSALTAGLLALLGWIGFTVHGWLSRIAELESRVGKLEAKKE